MRRTEWLLILAAISFIPTLFFYLVGEEGSYTVISLEMWHSRDWMTQTIYGLNLNRPPLINWLVIPLAKLMGWQHLVIATRFVTVCATLGMTGWLYWLCRRLFDDRAFALFAALACLSTADLLLYRGWLSYTDPLFAFFAFGAMASLWVASSIRHRGWLLVSVAMVSCALLTKAFTAYIFYGTVVFVLLAQRNHRSFLLSPASVLILCSILIVPYAWFSNLPHMGTEGTSMLSEISRKLATQNALSYVQRFFTYPLETAFRLSPAALLAAYLLLRKRVRHPEPEAAHFRSALFITALTILPYWLAPQGGIRYLLPAFPLVALVSARYIWRAGDKARNLALRWFSGLIALKFLFALVLFPYYQTHYRGENYAKTAHIVLERTRGFPLYVSDVSTNGLSITGYMDLMRLPLAPLMFPPADFKSGYVLARDADPALGKLIETYTLAADKIYLLCRGAACKID